MQKGKVVKTNILCPYHEKNYTISFPSLIYAEYLIAHQPSAALYLLPTRRWKMLIRAISALLLHYQHRPMSLRFCDLFIIESSMAACSLLMANVSLKRVLPI